MDVLLPLILPAVLFLALEILWCRPVQEHSLSGGRSVGECQPGAPPSPPEVDPFAWPFVQQRLDVLAAELERLEHDESIFALAFRTHVAKSAYEALLADATRLANASRLANAYQLAGTTIIEIEIPRSMAPVREELNV